ncbi:MAG: VCBS repeat-containing protein [Thermoplasmata archaeon]|nr:MAG: VCBS repeat-containing protein [Thermoplasmata archaeon]
MWKIKSDRSIVCALVIGMFLSLFSGLAFISEPADAVEIETSVQWYKMGICCMDVALVDINRDGYLDVVTASMDDDNFYTMTNDGKGNFENKTTYSDVAGQSSLMMGDIDGDGDPDIVHAIPYDDRVTVRFNTNGFGNFGSEQDYVVGKWPFHLYVGDVDGDSDLDIVTANSRNYNVSVLKNDGSGQYGNLKDYWVGYHPEDIHMGDINGDNYLDIVATLPYNDTIVVLFNDKAGAFVDLTNYTDFNNPYSISLGDIDGDSDQDIVVTNKGPILDPGEDSISVLKNDGTGKFPDRTDYPAGDYPSFIHLDDIDGDSDLDVLITKKLNLENIVGIFINSGDGSFKAKLEFKVGRGYPRLFDLGDIDKDGDLDIAVPNGRPKPDRISILINEGHGWFNIETHYPMESGPRSLFMGDIDGDDISDIVIANYGSSTISVYFNDGHGNFGERTDYTVDDWNRPNTVALGDINNDGDLDLFYSGGGTASSGYVSLRKNDGTGIFGSQYKYLMGSGPILYLAEVNGDNFIDMVTLNKNDNDLSVRINNGIGGFGNEKNYGGLDGLDNPSAIYMGDINEDNDMDIVVADTEDDEVVVFRNNGAGEFSWSRDYPVGDNPQAVIFGDVESDGDLDIIVGNAWSESVSILKNDGLGNFGTKTDYPVGEYPRSMCLGDIDSDSDQDLIIGNYYGHSITVYKNNGKGGFYFREDYPTISRVRSTILGDVDNDIDLDLAFVNEDSNSFTIRLNRNCIDFKPDNDNDGYPDFIDAFPDNGFEWVDSDGDGWGDNSEDLPWDPFEYVDSDGDRHGDQFDDAFPDDPTEWRDLDNDGWGDNSDQFPKDRTEWQDSDNDSIGDNADDDDDNDGFSDDLERSYGTDIHDANDHPPDFDGDNIPDDMDDDDDNDGWSNYIEEAAGSDPKDNTSVPLDTDMDGIANNADFDDDNDGVPDYDDYAPLDPKVQKDPNLIRFWGVEFEIGELVMGILMGIGAVILGSMVITRKKRLYRKYKRRLDESTSVSELIDIDTEIKVDTEKERLTYIQLTLLEEKYKDRLRELKTI